MKNLNANTVLLTIIMGLSAWTLKEVVALRENQAVLTYRVQALETRFQAILGTVSVNTARPPR